MLYFYEIGSPEMARADPRNERSLLVRSRSQILYAISVHLFPLFIADVEIHDRPIPVENRMRRHPINAVQGRTALCFPSLDIIACSGTGTRVT